MSVEGVANRDEIVPLLGPGRQKGGWYMTPCPAHAGDGTHHGKDGWSLGLSEKGVLRCFAGCSFEAVMEALRAGGRRGPAPRRATSREGAPVQRQATRNVSERARSGSMDGFELKVAYEYRDAAGELVAVKGRFERPDPESDKGYSKRFTWRHPDHEWKDGIKKYGLTIEGMPLWGVETVLAAPLDAPVWLCEGEKATEALRARNQVAVCGAWSASQSEFGVAFEVLRNRPVILWPDNDEPGREYMARVRRVLKRIARTVVVVNAPVPPAGDAVEYFRAGGKLDDLLAGVLTAPTVDVFASDHLTVRMPTDKGTVSFELKEMFRTRGALECELTVRCHSEAMEPEPLWQRQNLLSSSSRESLLRALRAQFGKTIDPSWDVLVSIAYARARETFEAGSPVEELAGNPDQPPAEFVVRGLVVVGGGTILYGPPGKGKSQTAMLLAVSVDAGSSRLFGVPRRRRVLYINLERSAQSMAGRLSCINEALYLEPDRPLLFLNARGKPLTDLVDRIKDAIRNHGVELVILDSISRAGLGDLNDNRTANAIVDVLNSFGVAWVGIAHTPRADETHVYGSVHQEAGADVMAALSSTKDEVGTLAVGISIPKANDFAPPSQQCLVFTFDGRGLSSARRAEEHEFEDIPDQSQKSELERVRDYLKSARGGATVTEIAEGLAGKVNRESVRKLCQRQREKGFFIEVGTERKGAVIYALRAGDPPPPKPRLAYAWDGDMDACHECGKEVHGYSLSNRPQCVEHFQPLAEPQDLEERIG